MSDLTVRIRIILEERTHKADSFEGHAKVAEWEIDVPIASGWWEAALPFEHSNRRLRIGVQGIPPAPDTIETVPA